MKPSIGRIVHFVNKRGLGTEIFPAIITSVHSDTVVNLNVFYDGRAGSVAGGESPFESSVPFHEGPELVKGSWFWPPKV